MIKITAQCPACGHHEYVSVIMSGHGYKAECGNLSCPALVSVSGATEEDAATKWDNAFNGLSKIKAALKPFAKGFAGMADMYYGEPIKGVTLRKWRESFDKQGYSPKNVKLKHGRDAYEALYPELKK